MDWNGFISRFEISFKNARDNVQYIGDMVPPLKMVGELSGKLASLGVVGAADTVKQIAYCSGEASREAGNLDVTRKRYVGGGFFQTVRRHADKYVSATSSRGWLKA
ncbi:hypothetical protein [Klebsiella pneumoniae]|uniref:hypothetical protein n=1 Tax=Klebsiella pneumoniae TaxID=573 RepID=UPI0035567CC0